MDMVSSQVESADFCWENAGVLLSSAYLAPVEYYRVMACAGKVMLEACDYYVKQTYRNRCRIATANGPMDLTVPVEKTGGDKQLMRDVKIAYHTQWQAQHWRAIASAYNSTPFFEYYKDYFRPFYEKKWTYLWDFNEALQAVVLEQLELQPVVERTDGYRADWGMEVMDLREAIHPKRPPVMRLSKPYYQVFAQKYGFLPNMSVIDLLFNMGNEAVLWLLPGQNR